MLLGAGGAQDYTYQQDGDYIYEVEFKKDGVLQATEYIVLTPSTHSVVTESYSYNAAPSLNMEYIFLTHNKIAPNREWQTVNVEEDDKICSLQLPDIGPYRFARYTPSPEVDKKGGSKLTTVNTIIENAQEGTEEELDMKQVQEGTPLDTLGYSGCIVVNSSLLKPRRLGSYRQHAVYSPEAGFVFIRFDNPDKEVVTFRRVASLPSDQKLSQSGLGWLQR